MAHKSYVDIAKQIAAAGWGKEFDDDNAAQVSLLKDVDLSGACLLGILRRIDLVLDALTESVVSEKSIELRRKAQVAKKRWIAKREEAHGPCPDDLKYWLDQQVCIAVGSYMLNGVISSHVSSYFGMPEKGTEDRKIYDRWMRRKKPTQSK